MGRTPVYFLSHGGPNTMFDYDHPAYSKMQAIGREITQKIKPKAILAVSAHWQAGPSHVEINAAETSPLIYDYYGFPQSYYSVKYPNKGSPSLAQTVLTTLHKSGVDARSVQRGLDHGVFVPFLVAFNPDSNPLNIPIVQLSLFDSDDADQHYRLGQALSSLRDDGILILVSGMAVHNLRDLRVGMRMPPGEALGYAVSFDAALKEAVEAEPSVRQAAMAELLKRKDARQAHPSFEHLLPIHVGAGAADADAGRQLWTLPQGSMSWAQYRFGELET